MKRLTATGATIIALAAGSILGAAPALAATTTSCSSANTTFLSGNSQTFTVGGGCNVVTWGAGSGVPTGDVSVKKNGGPDLTINAPTIVTNGDTITVTYTGSVTGGMNVTFTLGAVQDVYNIDLTGGGGTPSDSSSSSGSAPAPIVQQFGKPAALTCDEAQPEGLDWSGVASGGWGQSWAQWMNNGTGGAVCSRTLVYSANAGGWTVN